MTHDGGVIFLASDDTVRAKRAHGSIRGSRYAIFHNGLAPVSPAHEYRTAEGRPFQNRDRVARADRNS
jgi:hypothetical protein